MNWDEAAYAEDSRRREVGSGFPCLTDELFTDGAKWQRDRIRECFSNYPDPRCEEHPDGDPISCGWKNAYISIMNYLEETE